jgi:hypothetical protein
MKIINIFFVFLLFALLISGCKPAPSTLTIQVQDATTKTALQGAKVVSYTQPKGQLLISGITDQSGSVTFTNIIPGEYRFYISRADYKQVDYIAVARANRTTIVFVPMAKSP